MGQKPDEGVRSTSDWMASIRYRETLRPDAFLSDPCAGVLCGHSTQPAELLTGLGGPSEVVISRGWLGDQLIGDAVAGGLDQVVLLAAGSDARAWRLGLPASVTLFEVDLPGQHPHKTQLLATAGFAPTCRLIRVPADLKDPEWMMTLRAAGFDVARPAVWLVEGLFYYTSTDFARDLIANLVFPGSCLAFDIPHEGFRDEPSNQEFLAFMAQRGSPFTGFSSDPASLAPAWATRCYLAEDLPLPDRLIRPQHPIWHVTGTIAL